MTTAGNHRLIVRISHKENHRFEAERWALNTARLAGVPTPQVLLVERAEYDGIPVTFCIEEKVSGKPLDMLLKEGITSDLRKAIDKIGEVLSLLHSVRVDGFGYLQPDGKGQQTSFAEIMLMANERQYETLFHLVLLRESLIMLMVHAARKNPNGIQGFITEMERALRYFSNVS